jgi:hypothetical protein
MVDRGIKSNLGHNSIGMMHYEQIPSQTRLLRRNTARDTYQLLFCLEDYAMACGSSPRSKASIRESTTTGGPYTHTGSIGDVGRGNNTGEELLCRQLWLRLGNLAGGPAGWYDHTVHAEAV